MKSPVDFEGRSLRLTEERRRHILSHPEMKEMITAISETLKTPEKVIQSLSDSEARLYYRFYPKTPVGAKYLCVIAKIPRDDAFILTAYLTDSVKKGEVLWPEK